MTDRDSARKGHHLDDLTSSHHRRKSVMQQLAIKCKLKK